LKTLLLLLLLRVCNRSKNILHISQDVVASFGRLNLQLPSCNSATLQHRACSATIQSNSQWPMANLLSFKLSSLPTCAISYSYLYFVLFFFLLIFCLACIIIFCCAEFPVLFRNRITKMLLNRGGNLMEVGCAALHIILPLDFIDAAATCNCNHLLNSVMSCKQFSAASTTAVA